MIKQISKKPKNAGAVAALLSADMAVLLILFVIALFTLAYLVRNVIVLHKTGFDEAVFSFLKNHISDRQNKVMLFFTFLGTHTFLIPANLLLIAYFFFVKKNRWYSIKVPAIALTSLGLMFGLKHLFHRVRPNSPLLFQAEGLSFPSGHALFSITFYGLLMYIIYNSIWKGPLKWSLLVLLALLIVTIGFSRIYLRVHYATDVIAGFCVGFLWLTIALWVLNRMERSTAKNPTAPKDK